MGACGIAAHAREHEQRQRHGKQGRGAHRVHVPPVVFTMPACITMIPGLYAYRAMLGCIRITDLERVTKDPLLLPETAHYFVLTASLLFTLGIGICSGTLLFRKKSAKSLFKRTF